MRNMCSAIVLVLAATNCGVALADESYTIMRGAEKWTASPEPMIVPSMPNGRVLPLPAESVLLVPAQGDPVEKTQADVLAVAQLYLVKYDPRCIATKAYLIVGRGWSVEFECPEPVPSPKSD